MMSSLSSNTPTLRIRGSACLLLTLLALLLTACGGVGASYASATPAKTTPMPGSPSLNGCDTQHPPAHLPPANVIVTDETSASTPTPSSGATVPPTAVSTGVANPVATSYVNATPESTPRAPGTPIVLTPGPRPTSQPTPPYAQKVSMRVGQVLEVRLRASARWMLEPLSETNILVALNTKSWYDAQHQACVWRFVAQGNGEAQLSFTGSLICPPYAACPAIAFIESYLVIVK